jgi:hypothetical protein
MDNENPKDDNLFDKLGLSVQYGSVKVGETYPLYGTITKIIDDTPGSVVVLINDHIKLHMNIEDPEKVALLKNRAFDPGIFVCTITKDGENIEADCTTVVFGKQPNDTVQ